LVISSWVNWPYAKVLHISVIFSVEGLNGFPSVDRSVDARVLAAQGTETNAGMPYSTLSNDAMLLNDTVA
jgi:hypothetical protein